MRKMTMVLFACSLLLIISPSCGYAAINTSSPLSIGQTLSSPGGFYELGFFSPNNTRNLYVGIWFKEIVPRVVVWVANRDKPVTNSAANLTISSSKHPAAAACKASRTRPKWPSKPAAKVDFGAGSARLSEARSTALVSYLAYDTTQN